MQCKLIKTKRSRHCTICGRCVERFDHHCPWVNNCVGDNNHWLFLTFIFLTLTTCFIEVLFISVNFKDHRSVILEDRWYNKLAAHLPKAFYAQGVTMCFKIANLAITGIFILPLVLLNSVQCTNFCKGKTTNERYSGKTEVLDSTMSTNIAEEREPSSCLAVNCYRMCRSEKENG